jgi:hypothetical protein
MSGCSCCATHDGEPAFHRNYRSAEPAHIHGCEISLRKCVLFDSAPGGRELSGKSIAAGLKPN